MTITSPAVDAASGAYEGLWRLRLARLCRIEPHGSHRYRRAEGKRAERSGLLRLLTHIPGYQQTAGRPAEPSGFLL